MKDTRSKELYERAKVHIPGGVNSPVRAFRAVNHGICKRRPYY